MSTPTLIGMIGKKRSGKDTFAEALTETHDFARVAFADPLKEASYATNPIVGPAILPGLPGPGFHHLQDVVDAVGWETAKDKVPGVRDFLQRLGTEGIRALDDGFWLRIATGRISALRSIGSPVVVTDCRYPNEADAIRSAGGVIVRVTRDGMQDDGDRHPSETALDDYVADYHVRNNRSIDELQYVARSLATDLARMA